VVALTCFAVLALGGCKEKETVVGPTPVDPNAGKSALERAWPNEDGRAWEYAATERTWWGGYSDSLYPTPGDVPSLTIGQVAALLESHPIGDGATTTKYVYGLRFNGMITTGSGAVGQNLESTLSPDTSAASALVSNQALSSEGFLARLASARPDLRSRIERLRPSLRRNAGAAVSVIGGPMLLMSYAWARTLEWIGSYGALNTDVAWKYLVANLTTGSEFTLQLVPDLADDVFLHGRMLAPMTIVTESGTYSRALVCAYLVDFGLSAATDPDGNELGYRREYTYGAIAYARDIGPVFCYERDGVQAGSPPGIGHSDWSISLRSVTPGPTTTAGRFFPGK